MIDVLAADSRLGRDAIDALRPALEEGIRRARTEGGSVLVSTVVPAEQISPLAIFGHSRRTRSDGFYWERPAECRALAGMGAVKALTGEGAACLQQVEAAWQRVLATAVVNRGPANGGQALDGEPLFGPMLLGGAAFDPLHKTSSAWDGFPAARFVLPRLMLAARVSERWLTLNTLVEADASVESEIAAALTVLNGGMGERDPAARRTGEQNGDRSAAAPEGVPLGESSYEDLVCRARDAIRRGDAEKIVLARGMRLPGAVSAENTLERLRRVHPGCTLFAVAHGDRCFLGATPEGLVRRQGRTVQVSALAGTAGRGATPEEDARLARDLLASAKDREEHAVVVRMIRDSLAPVCDHISAPQEPGILRLRTVQHLSTPIEGHLSGETSILSLAARLHPTPAVGGLPSEAALRFLRRYEDLDRGWYAGPVGMAGANGDGDFVVAIRSALLLPDAALLFAGCGIMADSNPAREYAESCLKLESIRNLLTPSEPAN
jgi:isochorismate synthase